MAAIFLSLSTIGLSLFALPLLYLWIWSLTSRRWLVALGLPIFLVGLTLLGSALVPGWIIQWIRALVEAMRTGAALTMVADLGQGLAPILLASVLLILMLWQWFLVMGRGSGFFLWALGLTLATGFILHPYPRPVSVGMLLLPMILVARVSVERWSAAGWILVSTAGLLLLVLPWWATAQAAPAEHPSHLLTLWLPWLMTYSSLWWHRWWLLREPVAGIRRHFGADTLSDRDLSR
jgi:hypothetical protein